VVCFLLQISFPLQNMLFICINKIYENIPKGIFDRDTVKDAPHVIQDM